MHNINLRQAILQNVKGKTEAELQDIIQDAVGNEEKVLPGLGVLFEVIWQHSDEQHREQMLETLHQNV